MRFLIISHVLHAKKDDQFYGYAPYVREMNLWVKHAEEVEIVAPIEGEIVSEIDLAYKHGNITFTKIPSTQFTSITYCLKSLIKIPIIKWKIFRACLRADHIHLRCPGNTALFGVLIQICFPKKIKTAKYAGNWDPKSKQPLSYRFQKSLLSNTFLTKNMQVLVYGDWPSQSKNIKSFFTATFKQSEIIEFKEKDFTSELNFIFIGSLVAGKGPLEAIRIIQHLKKEGFNVNLQLFGDGVLKTSIQDYIDKNELNHFVKLRGNVNKDKIKEALSSAHFSLLLSKSEGWPKAIAEAMFYGVIPISTKVSCVPWMLGYGKRGILVSDDFESTIDSIKRKIKGEDLNVMSKAALDWSQQYTLDTFEDEIRKLLKN
ncbi:MAG: glycosyltransferase [Winogradskyella sp.]